MRQLNESTAWRIVAAMHGHRYGLCHSVSELESAGAISINKARAMRARIDAERKRMRSRDNYLWPFPEDAAARLDSHRFAFAMQASNAARAAELAPRPVRKPKRKLARKTRRRR